MRTAQRIAVTKTELPPCCLRIHPEDPSVVLLGTYKLEESGARHGSVDVYRTENGHFRPLGSTPTSSAILDLKFCPGNSSLFVSAHSTGEIRVWAFEDAAASEKRTVQVFEPDVLVTSVFFDPRSAKTVLATATSGEAALVDLETGECVYWTSHSLECWTGAFGESAGAENVVFTGGDDAKLAAHDRRMECPIWATGPRFHDAGVVSILCSGEKWLPSKPSTLWTGSYDDCLRTFDLRMLDSPDGPVLHSALLPKENSRQNLNGGVWRLIPAPDATRVLACCMYDGARIIEPGDGAPNISTYFKGDHESMCYGGDWVGENIVTCSFYDNVVQQWA
ncbi:putative diphthamide synthase [Clavispora lusitaniae]|uniref:methylated diphthine methylhydrolase n=1 Tax=Clavispora lusitaniae TaxID=36911 RepID=A0AA91PXM5_CLALS|nr:putative diphthamide synthase [Clavispora lusitaniae]